MIESPINYMGSKFKLLHSLLTLFPKDKDVFIDMFTGGGSVYMNVAKDYKKTIANDTIDPLIRIHRSLHNLEFVKLAKECSERTKESKENYSILRDNFNTSNYPHELLALIWSCNSNMMRFNLDKKFNQTHGKRCFNKNTQKKHDRYMEAYKNGDYKNTVFTCFDFKELFQKIKEKNQEDLSKIFIYLDPPYSNTEAGYNAFWKSEDDNALIENLKFLVDNNVAFGISGVNNGKSNPVYDALKDFQSLTTYTFGDLYQKISKKDKTNEEYYITNV